jgi:hypothetical protein
VATPSADTSDPAWHPAEEMDVVSEGKAESQPKNETIAAMPTPNKRTILTGQLRARN